MSPSHSAHLAELRRKHQLLADQIESEQRSPAADDLNLKALKIRKLHIKEEITRLES